MQTAKQLAEQNEILKGVVGSTAHGTSIEGTDDRDEMGVFVEDPEEVCGLTPVDHYIHRDAAEGERSKPGDLDLTFYSLRRFCQLGVKGNPHTLNLLWLPEYITQSPIGEGLVNIRQSFISRHAANAFMGYLVSQKKKLKGEKAHTVNRPELIEKYGYDTKFAGHAVRLGYQGIELIREGKITLPMRESERKRVIDVRTGQFSFEEVLNMIDGLEAQLIEAASNFNKEPEYDVIIKFLVRAHQWFWAW
jgi:uncharacterized protein